MISVYDYKAISSSVVYIFYEALFPMYFVAMKNRLKCENLILSESPSLTYVKSLEQDNSYNIFKVILYSYLIL